METVPCAMWPFYTGDEVSGVRGLKGQSEWPLAVPLSGHTAPCDRQNVLVAWQRRKEGDEVSQAFSGWGERGEDEQAWGRVA